MLFGRLHWCRWRSRRSIKSKRTLCLSKDRELASVLTLRAASLKVKGKVYRACIQSVLGYASETWAIKVEDMARLERTERMMVRWICGVHLKSRTASAKLNSRLGLECITDVV